MSVHKQLEQLETLELKEPIEIFQLKMLSTVSYFSPISLPLATPLVNLYLTIESKTIFQCQKIKISVNKSIWIEPNQESPRFEATHTHKSKLWIPLFVRHGIQFSVFNFEFTCVKVYSHKHFYFFFNSRSILVSFVHLHWKYVCAELFCSSDWASGWLFVAGSWSRIYHQHHTDCKVLTKKECEKTYMNPGSVHTTNGS